nr:15787_t:CDS:2 [Entrophospora candida]
MEYLSREDRLKLKYPDYWDRDPSVWGDINDWDSYWVMQPQLVAVNRCNSHSSLSEELINLKNIFDTMSPAYKKKDDIQNVKIWENADQLVSLKIDSNIIDLKLEIDKAKGFKVAQRGLQEYSDAEFNIMRNGMFSSSYLPLQITENNKIQATSVSWVPESQNYHEVQKRSNCNELLDDNNDIITNGMDNCLQKAVESMVGKVESDRLKVDDVDLEEAFEKYRDECENEFDLCNSDIMDLRPTSRLAKIIPEATWEKFILDTYPNHKISEKWENSIRDFFKPKDTLTEWEKAWRGIFNTRKNIEDLVIKDILHNILSPYIEAFKAPFNILKSGDLEEKQYNSQFINPILKNTLKAICDLDWRILEVPIRSSKYRRNFNINPFIDKILSAKRADGLARLWQSQEEIFVYEQTGSPDVDDITDFYVHDYRLVRTMRDVLNQRIILRLNNGIKDYNNLASFGAFGHRDEVSLFWCTIHPKSYCLREYASFHIPTTWQDLPVLSEAIISCLKFFSFMKDNIKKIESRTEQKMKLLSKRKVHTVIPNPPTPDRTKKQNNQSKKQKK